jgi:hypothetical protein
MDYRSGCFIGAHDGGGGAIGYRTYQQNRPTRVWLPMPIDTARPLEMRDKTVAILKQRLSDPVVLAAVSKDAGYAKNSGIESDAAAAKDLARRLFVEIGTADTPLGRVPSINVGMECKVKEFRIMRAVVNRLKTDVFKILGLTEPKQGAN